MFKPRRGLRTSLGMTQWERSYWVLRDHILHGYEGDDLTTEVAHLPLDGSHVKHESCVLHISIPGVDGNQTWQLKAEKDSDAYVWVAVMLQSNKVREKSHADAAFKNQNPVGGKKVGRKQLEVGGQEYDDYEI